MSPLYCRFPVVQGHPTEATSIKYDHLAMYPRSYDVLDPNHLAGGHHRSPHLSSRPKDIFYYFTHLRFAVLEGDSDRTTSQVSATDPVATQETFPPIISNVDHRCEMTLLTSDFLPLHDNDDPPTPAMIGDLRRFVFLFVRSMTGNVRFVCSTLSAVELTICGVTARLELRFSGTIRESYTSSASTQRKEGFDSVVRSTQSFILLSPLRSEPGIVVVSR